ncbi:MAG: RND family transporter [Myxococcota bacterium]
MAKKEGNIIVSSVERWLGALALASFRRPFAALILILLVTALASFQARRLSLDADLAELLPKSFQSVRDLDTLKKRFGGIGYVAVLAFDAPPDELRRFADELAPKLESLQDVSYVDYRRATDFFEKRILYYLENEDLKSIAERLTNRKEWEVAHNNPLYIDLDESPPPSLDFSDLTRKYSDRSDSRWLKAQLGESYYLDPHNRVVALLAKPATLSTDLNFSRKLVNQVRGVVSSLDLSSYPPSMRIVYAGNFTKKVDQQELIQRDLAVSSTIALLLVLFYLAFHFRRFAAIPLMLLPLIIGLIWIYGFAAWLFTSLNILTGFIGVILLGLGIDHGIHLLGRFEPEWARRDSAEEALKKTFSHTGRAVIIAGLTTTIGFAGLGFSEFRAFKEFGVLAAVGMIFIVTSYTLCLPALLGVLTRFGWHPRKRGEETESYYALWLPRHSKVVFITTLIIFHILFLFIPRIDFNYDTRSLAASHLESFRMDHTIDSLLGHSQTPVVVLTENEEEERKVADALRKKQDELGKNSTIDFVAAGSDLVPPRQEEKLGAMREIRDAIDGINKGWLKKDDVNKLDKLREMTLAEPFSTRDLPEQVKRLFYGASDKDKEGFVLIYASVDLSDGSVVSDFAREVRGISLDNGKSVSAAGEAMIVADIFDMVRREGPPVLVMVIILVIITMWLLLGSFKAMLVAIAPAILTLLGTLGLIPLVNQELNYLNVVMVSALVGIAVDGGIHIVTQHLEGAEMPYILDTTGRAIAGSILTTIFGFGALFLADHHGLNTLGALAVLGLTVNFIACLVWLPSFLSFRKKPAAQEAKAKV